MEAVKRERLEVRRMEDAELKLMSIRNRNVELFERWDPAVVPPRLVVALKNIDAVDGAAGS